jgi:hypothetical protein
MHLANQYGLVAQSVEQRPFKPLVVGSNPTQPTIQKIRKAGAKRRLFCYVLSGKRIKCKHTVDLEFDVERF